MHILLIADARSPTTRSWLSGLLELRYEVSLVSSYPFEPLAGLKHFAVIPLAGAGLRKAVGNAGSGQAKPPGVLRSLRPVLLKARHQLGPLTLAAPARRLAELCADWQPDV